MASRGVVIGGSYERLADRAREVEARGFDAAWLPEIDSDSILQASVALGATSHLEIGTDITVAFPRSPTITATSAWDLNGLFADRFVLGLGSQVRRIVEERFSADFDRPAARMAEYVQAMQAVWRMERGEDVTFRGDIYRVVRPAITGLGHATGRALPRTHVAAVGPLMIRAAARHADGILGHPFTSARYLAERVLPRVEEALADAGRSRDDFSVCQGLILCVADDREQAVREAKQQIAFYGTTPNYRPVFASHGDEELTDRLRRVLKGSDRDPDALAAAVPDEAVERYAVAGTPDEASDRLAAFEREVAAGAGRGIDHLILGGAWFGVPRARAEENHAAILETFAASGDG